MFGYKKKYNAALERLAHATRNKGTHGESAPSAC